MGVAGTPKTKSETVLQHFPPLRGVADADWDEMFSRQGARWEADENDYVREWYGRLDTIEIAYALQRLPYSVQERARKLGVSGTTSSRRKGRQACQ